ncbi:MAG: hypothetical protein WBJ68_18855, partial [Candidatus Dechloromonas phosphoritropha]
MKKVLGFFRQLLGYVEPASKAFLWLVGVFLVLVLLLDVYKDVSPDVVYVDTFELPEDVVKSGTTPKQFTDRAVQTAISRVDARRATPSPAVTSFERQKRIQLEPNECQSRMQPLQHLFAELEREIKSKPASEWRRTDLVLPQAGVPLRALSDAVRRVLDLPAVRISGAIVKPLGSDTYVVRVLAHLSSTEVQVSELPAKDISDAEKRAGILILKYANPAVFASTIHVTDPEQVAEALLAAGKHWTHLRSRSLPYTIIGYLALNSQEHASPQGNASIAKYYFDKALQIDKADVLAEIGSVAAQILMDRPMTPGGALDGSDKKSLEENLRRLGVLGPQGPVPGYAFAVKALLHGHFSQNDDALVERSSNMITYHVSSRSNFFQRNTTGVAFISSIPFRMRALSS